MIPQFLPYTISIDCTKMTCSLSNEIASTNLCNPASSGRIAFPFNVCAASNDELTAVERKAQTFKLEDKQSLPRVDHTDWRMAVGPSNQFQTANEPGWKQAALNSSFLPGKTLDDIAIFQFVKQSFTHFRVSPFSRRSAVPLVSTERQETSKATESSQIPSTRLNKFVRRLHNMLLAEKDNGIVEWRRGLLVLKSTDAFAKKLLPKYFNTRNFKTFRRQLNYYGFVHVRSFSSTGNMTTALWVNRELAQVTDNDNVASVLLLKRVEPCEAAKTVEGRRVRKELAISTVEEDLGVSSKAFQVQQIKAVSVGGTQIPSSTCVRNQNRILNPVPFEIHCPSIPIKPRLACANIIYSASDTESGNEDNACQPRRYSCDTRTQSTVGMVSHDSYDCASNSDESTCAANLLLMLSKT